MIPTFASSNDSEIQLPKWFKNSAIWWYEGATTDRDIINSIEHLLDKGIIKIKLTETNPNNFEDASEEKSTAEIPSFVKDIFGYWAQDRVPDADIANSIGYLIQNGIIKSQAIQIIQSKMVQEDSLIFPSEVYKISYVTMKWNELVLNIVLQIANYEAEILSDASEKQWEHYAEDQNMETMKLAQSLEQLTNNAKSDTLEVTSILKGIKTTSEDIKKLAQKSDHHVLDLEEAAHEPIIKLEEIKKINNPEDLKDMIKDAKNYEAESNRLLRSIITDILNDNEEKINNIIEINPSNLGITILFDFYPTEENLINSIHDGLWEEQTISDVKIDLIKSVITNENKDNLVLGKLVNENTSDGYDFLKSYIEGGKWIPHDEINDLIGDSN